MTALLLRCPRLRRWLASFAVAFAGLLGGCMTGSTPAVTIAAAQAESQAILTALQAGAKIYTTAPTTTPAEAAAVQQMLVEAEAANAAIQGEIPTGSAPQMIETVDRDIVALLGVMPIDPTTKIAVDAGMAVLDTFIAEQMQTPTRAAGPKLAARPAIGHVAPRAVDLPPVPIPVPHRLPPTGSPSAAHAPEV